MKAKQALDIDALVAEAVPPRPNAQLVFTIPGLRVDSETNGREHWAKKYKRKARQKAAISLAWPRVTAGFRKKVSLPCVVRLVRIGSKKLDGEDNLREAFKTIKDAIARELCGGVNRFGVDDGDERITWEYEQCAVGKRHYAVRVEVY